MDAILNGSINNSSFKTDPIFGVDVPETLEGVETRVLDPQNAWANKADYDATAKKLSGMFKDNYQKFIKPG